MAGSGSLEVARGKGFVCGLVQVARAHHDLLRRSACSAPGQCGYAPRSGSTCWTRSSKCGHRSNRRKEPPGRTRSNGLWAVESTQVSDELNHP